MVDAWWDRWKSSSRAVTTRAHTIGCLALDTVSYLSAPLVTPLMIRLCATRKTTTIGRLIITM